MSLEQGNCWNVFTRLKKNYSTFTQVKLTTFQLGCLSTTWCCDPAWVAAQNFAFFLSCASKLAKLQGALPPQSFCAFDRINIKLKFDWGLEGTSGCS